MNKKKIVIIAIIAIVILLALAAWFAYQAVRSRTIASDQTNSVTANMEKAAAVLPGGNKISVEQKVITDAGTAVKTDVMPNNLEAPKAVTVTKAELPGTAINIGISGDKFTPETFTVKAGAPVSLAFSSLDKKVHVVVFADSSLAALSFGISGGKIKAMTFNAPTTPGKYEFKCDVPGHQAAGEQGTMIVE